MVHRWRPATRHVAGFALDQKSFRQMIRFFGLAAVSFVTADAAARQRLFVMAAAAGQFAVLADQRQLTRMIEVSRRLPAILRVTVAAVARETGGVMIGQARALTIYGVTTRASGPRRRLWSPVAGSGNDERKDQSTSGACDRQAVASLTTP